MIPVEKMLQAMTYRGNRVTHAWYMAQATYAYTRAHDGSEIAPGEYITFSRWYSFCVAWQIFWGYLWNPR